MGVRFWMAPELMCEECDQPLERMVFGNTGKKVEKGQMMYRHRKSDGVGCSSSSCIFVVNVGSVPGVRVMMKEIP